MQASVMLYCFLLMALFHLTVDLWMLHEAASTIGILAYYSKPNLRSVSRMLIEYVMGYFISYDSLFFQSACLTCTSIMSYPIGEQ